MLETSEGVNFINDKSSVGMETWLIDEQYLDVKSKIQMQFIACLALFQKYIYLLLANLLMSISLHQEQGFNQ